MADFSTLIASIEATIKQNGVQAITGQVLQDELLLMVSAINQLKQDTLEGYAFYGEPLPNGATRVVTQNTFFLASAGTYTINGSTITISDAGVSVIVYDCVNDEITTYALFAFDVNPTNGSANAVTSGGVKSALDTKADKNGVSPDLFAGYAGNLVDTRSAGTPQGPYAFRQSGGDGVDYMVRIKGKTEAFNQMVGDNDTEVTVPSGHQYFAIIGGTASVATSDGSPISVTGGVDIVVDLTLEGLGFTTADQFRALHPLPYYNPMSKLINNAATGIKTRGFNQWDEEWRNGYYSDGVFAANASFFANKNYIPVFAGDYYFKAPFSPAGTVVIVKYDGNKNFIGNQTLAGNAFTIPSGVAYINWFTNSITTYNHDICINLSDASRNGTYEPYWERTLALKLKEVTGIPVGGSEADRVTIFPDGLAGVGTAQDMFYEENGVAKAKKKMAEVDLGGLTWTYGSSAGHEHMRTTGVASLIKKPATNSSVAPIICSKFSAGSSNDIYAHNLIEAIGVATDGTIYIYSSTMGTDPAAFKTAMAGVKLRYELATPIVYTDLQNADGTPFVFPKMAEVDNLGTQERLPADTADNPQGGFECDSNYSISTANLVRKLSE